MWAITRLIRATYSARRALAAPRSSDGVGAASPLSTRTSFRAAEPYRVRKRLGKGCG